VTPGAIALVENQMTPKIAFNTANLVARVSGYRFKLDKWGEQDRLTRERTDEREFAAICRDVEAAGYRAVEVWAAHVDPTRMTDARAIVYRRILADHGLAPIGLAGSLNDATARVCQQLGIPACNGGYWGSDRATVGRVMAETGLRFNYENHPERDADAIRQQVAGLGDHAGVALDTGWLGTHHVDAPAAVRALGPLVRHVHLKDVAPAGTHSTCPLGQGAVDIPGVVAALKETGYAGWYSWEDEPEDRNPLDIARAMREYVEGLLAS
jgi:sugar phosphate isomerase/epimerase